MNRQALRELVEAFNPGAAVSLPREVVLELLDVSAVRGGEPTLLTVAQLAARYHQGESTIRTRLERGEFPGAFKTGKAWRVPRQAVEAEEQHRGLMNAPAPAPSARRRVRNLGDWRQAKPGSG